MSAFGEKLQQPAVEQSLLVTEPNPGSAGSVSAPFLRRRANLWPLLGSKRGEDVAENCYTLTAVSAESQLHIFKV